MGQFSKSLSQLLFRIRALLASSARFCLLNVLYLTIASKRTSHNASSSKQFSSDLVRLNESLLAFYLNHSDLQSRDFSIVFNQLNVLLSSLYLRIDSSPSFVFSDQLALSLREALFTSLADISPAVIPNLARRTKPVQNTWEYQNHSMKWNFPADHKILDVGSGGWPFSYATHLADRFPNSTTHRTEALKTDHRPFTVTDIESLDFENGAFDFVFCSHVLEHTSNPGKAMRELMRVAASGYIEVPTKMSDVCLNFTHLLDHHKWHGTVQDNTLVLMEWLDDERIPRGNQLFDALQSQYTNPFQSFFEANRSTFFASLHWKDSFEFIVIDKHGKIIDRSP